MALNAAQTATEIVAAQEALPPEATAQDRMEAMINALYTRIKADIVITSEVAAGIAVATTGSPSAQTGATTAPGMATSQAVT